MPAYLIFGDASSLSLRHEVPIAMPDPVAYLEVDGRREVIVTSLDITRMTELGAREGFDVSAFENSGLAEFMSAGQPLDEAVQSSLFRALEERGVRAVSAPADFPLAVADFLRAGGIQVSADAEEFDRRRRTKSGSELAGIRRGLQASEAGLAAVREALRAGGPITVEELREAARVAFVRHGAAPHDMLVVAPGPQGADPHGEGSGLVSKEVPIVVDVFAKDMESGCWGDLTRTLCVGRPPDELVRWHADVREAQRVATAAVRPGVTGAELNRLAMECLAERGHQVRSDGEVAHGFTHYLGHGVGLDIHEAPTLDHGGEELVPGDVVTIEPGLYRGDFGGCRLEDMVLVTDDGHEVLTTAPYDIEP